MLPTSQLQLQTSKKIFSIKSLFPIFTGYTHNSVSEDGPLMKNLSETTFHLFLDFSIQQNQHVSPAMSTYKNLFLKTRKLLPSLPWHERLMITFITPGWIVCKRSNYRIRYCLLKIKLEITWLPRWVGCALDLPMDWCRRNGWNIHFFIQYIHSEKRSQKREKEDNLRGVTADEEGWSRCSSEWLTAIPPESWAKDPKHWQSP